MTIFAQAKALHPEFVDISWLNMDEMTWGDLPASIRKDGVSESSEEKFLIRIRAWGNIYDEEYRGELLGQLEEVNPDIFSEAILWPELIDAMTEDVIRVCIFAAIPILVIVYVGFRRRTPFMPYWRRCPFCSG